MPAHDPALDDAVRKIANILATAHLRLRFPELPVSTGLKCQHSRRL